MLHVLYIIIDISCPRKRINNPGMSCMLEGDIYRLDQD